MRDVGFALPSGLALLALALVPSVASAQSRPNAVAGSNGDGFDTHLFRPALDSRGFFSVNGVDVLGANAISLGLVGDYGRGVLRVPDVGQRSTTLIDSSLTGTFHFNYGIANRAVIGVSAPVILMSGDEQVGRGAPPAPAVPGWGPQAVDVQSLQHLALHAKVKLTRASNGVGVAVAAQVGVPVSDAPKNGGADPSLWYWPMVILEKRFGSEDQLRIAVNAGYRGHAASTTTLALRDGRFRDGARVTYGAGASLRVLEPLDVLVETYGTYLLSDSAAAVKPSNEALAGIKVFVEKSSYLVIGAGPRYTSGFEAADLRATVGFIFEPPIGDADGDGVIDSEDDCPNRPGVRSDRPHMNGCPADDDDDGIPNAEDACPFIKGVRTSDPRTNGCPADRDKVILDRDKDGVPDAEDACPDVFGNRHPDPKRNGCPDILIGPDIFTVFDKIRFRTGSAEILPESDPILDKVAKALNEHPELTLLEVAGHADERGGEQMNLALTQARVDSVMSALIARSVDRTRLRAKGYGYYCPLDPAHEEEAWALNRRVEFIVVRNASGPTKAPVGCDNAAAHGVRPKD